MNDASQELACQNRAPRPAWMHLDDAALCDLLRMAIQASDAHWFDAARVMPPDHLQYVGLHDQGSDQWQILVDENHLIEPGDGYGPLSWWWPIPLLPRGPLEDDHNSQGNPSRALRRSVRARRSKTPYLRCRAARL